jgi:hypothetical protein
MWPTTRPPPLSQAVRPEPLAAGRRVLPAARTAPAALALLPAPINVLYSIDYEVFWTHNDDEVRVLVEPTERLLRQAEELGVRYTLFVDVLCLFRYRELGLTRFVNAVEHQLRDAVQRGHDVQTHLHPHWLTAQRLDDEWSFDSDSFVLGALGDADQVCSRTKELLERARQYFEALLKPVSPDYRTVAYRAGGFGLQPHERAVLKALEDTGYLIESSIIPGMRRMTGRYHVDFTSVPAHGNWIIGSEGGLDQESASGLLEVPIPSGTIDPLPFVRQIANYLSIGRRRGFLDGYGHSYDGDGGRAAMVGSVRESWSRKFRILISRRSRLAIPLAPGPALKNLTGNWIAKHARDGAVAFSMLLHSKGLTQNMLDDLRSYTHWIRSRYPGQVTFLTFLELARFLEVERRRDEREPRHESAAAS